MIERAGHLACVPEPCVIAGCHLGSTLGMGSSEPPRHPLPVRASRVRNPKRSARTLETAGSIHSRNLRTIALEEMVGAHRELLPNRSGPRLRECQQEGRNYTRKLAFRHPEVGIYLAEQCYSVNPAANCPEEPAQAPFVLTSRRGRSSTTASAAPPVFQPNSARARVARLCAATGSIANP